MLRRGCLHLVALLVLAGCSAGPARRATDIDPAPLSALYDGAQMMQEGRAPDALQHFEALVAAHPQSWGAHRGLQNARLALWPRDRVAGTYRDASRSGGAIEQYLLGRAVIEDDAAARAAFEASLELEPEAPWPVVGLSFLEYRRGDLFETVRVYEQALKRAPRSRVLRLRLGNQYLELKLFVEAQRQLEVALRLAPDDAEVLAALGKAYLGMRYEERALDLLERSLEAEPRMGDVYPVLSALYLRLERPADAQRAYREGLRLGQPPDAELAAEIRVGLLIESRR